ncbi:MAG: hypothetical protein MI923_21605 [Phycisphaerales bacterium]|nr:hypothetical protein [Phycisphaerales bacterium]
MRACLFIAIGSFISFVVSGAHAGSMTIDWLTVDGGGQMVSTGGTFELAGTIGQTDASSFDMPIAGGGFELAGGFWSVAFAGGEDCECLADVNQDLQITGIDIQAFVDCFFGIGPNCDCADVDGIGGLDLNDIDEFVTHLLSGATCP